MQPRRASPAALETGVTAPAPCPGGSRFVIKKGVTFDDQ